ncbi:hypothetical protein [Thermoflavifilum thermophilum]|uniref:Uncharacterized protein n=1 Tax=Thermoflavifilum thermophilum TaxID=1393122 RepID=A0A1I7NKQ5_9BACT|nr:hypothetical protein [Thermoflavifilum thermophilum]SFV35254.1 hypothetical protein SAMN05660895_2190 [Thermoflavifilum thermophilum]
MFKIFYPNQDELIVTSIPFRAYAGTGLLLMMGALLVVFASQLHPVIKPLGLVFIICALWLACLGIHRKELIVKRNLQVIYYIRKNLFQRKIKRYYFYEIRRFFVHTPHQSKAKQQIKKTYQVLMQKVSGRYKVLFHERNLLRAQRAVHLLEDYIRMA